MSLRQRVLDFIEQHEEDFAPFVEDDEPFAKYVARMRKVGRGEAGGGRGPGTWGAQPALLVRGRLLGRCTRGVGLLFRLAMV